MSFHLPETEDKTPEGMRPSWEQEFPGALWHVLGVGSRNIDGAAPTGTREAATPADPRTLGNGKPLIWLGRYSQTPVTYN